MKRFKVLIEAEIYNDGIDEEYTVHANTAAEAKKKAIKMFDENIGLDEYFSLNILVEGKDVKEHYSCYVYDVHPNRLKR